LLFSISSAWDISPTGSELCLLTAANNSTSVSTIASLPKYARPVRYDVPDNLRPCIHAEGIALRVDCIALRISRLRTVFLFTSGCSGLGGDCEGGDG
jgi:hypothetical protein